VSVATARLFVALDLPAEPRAALTAWAERELSAQPGVRLVAAPALHLTLCFLGRREEADVEALAAVVDACSSPPPSMRLEIGGLAWLPPRRPRVLAVDLADPDASVAALQARVSAALADIAAYEPEVRPFRPHVTVARAARGARLRAFAPSPPPALRFAGEALTLYRSRLGPDGARYEPVVRRPLAPAGTS
jgi:2'-5' RNA ligase